MMENAFFAESFALHSGPYNENELGFGAG